MATLATSLTSTGNLLVNGTFDEVTLPSGSLLFDGTGDFIKTPTNSAFDLSSGNFTIEFFAYFTSVIAGQHILTNYNNPGGNLGLAIYTTSIGTLNYYLSSTGSTIDIASGSLIGNISTGIWYHIALVRNGSTFTPYLNGVAGTTATSASAVYDNSFFNIGGDGYTNINQSFFGYLTNFRYVKGAALYTANFTPSIGILESTANTSLLLNVLNSTDFIKDNSRNNFSVTRNGNTAYNSLSPFNRGAHSVSNNTVFTRLSDEVSLDAGSIFFDGTGDYLTVTNSAALQLTDATAFTIECWVYPTNLTSPSKYIFENFNSSSPFQGYGLAYNINSTNAVEWWDGGGTWANTGITLTTNEWTHIAVTYEGSGTTRRFFKNGVLSGSAGTVSSSINYTAGACSIGAQEAGNSPWFGYISNLRILKGTALYTANFTPQQTILDSTANTSLLLNVLTSTDFKKDSSPNNFTVIANGDAAWNANGPFNQGVTRLVERRLSNATLVKDQFDEFTGAPVVDSSLVLWLDAEQPSSYVGSGSNWVDLSRSSANVTLYNTPTFTRVLNGGRLSFVPASTQYGEMNNLGSLSTWTVEAWFRTTASLGGYYTAIFGQQDYINKINFYIGNGDYDNTIRVGFSNAGFWGGGVITSGFTPTVMTWYHVVGTYEGTVLRQYVNGLENSNVSNSSGSGSNGGNYRIARSGFGDTSAGNLVPAEIAVLRLYNRNLSADEISQNFNALRRRFSI